MPELLSAIAACGLLLSPLLVLGIHISNRLSKGQLPESPDQWLAFL